MGYTQEQLEIFMKDAWSYENRSGWGAEELATEYIGAVKKGRYIYDLYIDTGGKYWYKTRVITECGVMTTHEATFGYPYQEWKRRKKRSK